MSIKHNRIDHEKAFLLNSAPWSESSLRIEVFSENHGRLSLLARSARKRQSELRGVLMPFVPLQISWYGLNELRTLHRAEWIGGWQQPQNQKLLHGMYINELVMKLTAKEDPHPQLYLALETIMSILAKDNNHTVEHLRYFEWQLLNILGYAPDITQDTNSQAIESEAQYCMRTEDYPWRIDSNESIKFTTEPYLIVSGDTLLSLNNKCLQSTKELQQALQLNRMLLDFRLNQQLESRVLIQQLRTFNRE